MMLAVISLVAQELILDARLYSTLDIPFPTSRLASIAHRALSVDKELSSLVRRSFSTDGNVLRVFYEATTNRMLRVAVNSFMDSLHLVIEVMEELDVDVLEATKVE